MNFPTVVAMSTDQSCICPLQKKLILHYRTYLPILTHSQGPPLPGSATPRVRHSQGPLLPGYATPRVRHYMRIRTFRSPYPFSITSRRRELKGERTIGPIFPVLQ